MSETKTGIELIAEERKRQIEVEGLSLLHDLNHDAEELVYAAVCYASPKILYEQFGYANEIHFKVLQSDWSLKLPQRGNVILDNNTLPKKKRIDQLIKAGALIAAEIDRLSKSKQ